MSDTVGFACIALSCVFWGSNFVPVKEFPTGNGLYYQWIMAMGIWLTGLVAYLIQGCPPFIPILLIGGFCWATGNVMTVLIVRLIGLGLGMLVWGTSCLVMGWASGRFGLFGIHAQTVANPLLNYVGVVLAILGGLSFVLVRPTLDTKAQEEKKGDEEEMLEHAENSTQYKKGISKSAGSLENQGEHTHLLGAKRWGTISSPITLREKAGLRKRIRDFLHGEDYDSKRHEMLHYFHLDALGLSNELETTGRHCLPFTRINIDAMPAWQKRALGFVMAIVAGLLYGVNFNPAQYYMDNNPDASRNGLDYVFPHYCGIMLTSSVYFILYGMLARNNPQIFPQVTLPALSSGAMWGIAQMSFFVANARLSMTIAVPISTIGPGVVASIWSVLVFREIQGRSNFIALFASFATSFVAIILITLSSV